MPPPSLIIWRLLDGKPGHEKQTLGLANALSRLQPCQRHDIAAAGMLRTLGDWVSGRHIGGGHLPDPHLILAAGHATHLPALVARHTRHGRCVVLMKPSLPLAWFDLCLIPEHDDPPRRDNVMVTRGVLNALEPTQAHRPDHGLLLIGGKSAHYVWDDRAVASRVRAIVTAAPAVQWRLTTSRRTPSTFLPVLTTLPLPDNLAVVPVANTPSGWVEEALAEAGQTWVTEDSVSMVYEALTSGSRVGIIPLVAQGTSRVRRGVATLIAEGMVATPTTSDSANLAIRSAPPFNEAERCARLILEKWPAIAN